MGSIVLTGGGTAGHCIPHLAILPLIHDSFDNVCYIGSKNGIESRLMSGATDYFPISTVKFKRSLSPENLLIPFRLLKAVSEAKKILKEIKPNVVFSKGGFVSLPVCIAARRLKIPVVAHESDLSLGLTNKITAKWCDSVLTTFPETALSVKNGRFVGAPIREELFYADKAAALKKFNLSPSKPVLLVIGGSSGSLALNKAVQDNLVKLLGSYQVLHICGRGHMPSCKTVSGYRVVEFVSDMAAAYKACDFAVSRAGSNAACELIALKIPTLFVPLSKAASRGDQLENAEKFRAKKLCRVLYEENLESDFLQEVNRLYDSREQILAAMKREPSIIGNRKIAEILKAYS